MRRLIGRDSELRYGSLIKQLASGMTGCAIPTSRVDHTQVLSIIILRRVDDSEHLKTPRSGKSPQPPNGRSADVGC